MRLTLASRASALAVLQAEEVARALRAQDPSLEVTLVTRSSEGDRNMGAALWALPDKGLFTADLSDALIARDVDAVVHSWKDLPIEHHPGTVVAATLERADPRDVLLVRRESVEAKPSHVAVLSSSPRRGWQVSTSLARLLPWPVEGISILPVRGNVPTRVRKLLNGDGDALVVAKAALDRLLSAAAPDAVVSDLRAMLDRCCWMVLPIKEHPTAPAQGALAVEVAADRHDVRARLRAISHEPTWRAVQKERAILLALGGGCHAAVGATVLAREYGDVTSVRGHLPTAQVTNTWTLTSDAPAPPRVEPSLIWPQPVERDGAHRRPLVSGTLLPPTGTDGWWVSRAEALPATWTVAAHQLVWTAGSRTWERLAARGVWVHGCADGLGDLEPPDIDRLAGRSIRWQRLTHADSDDPTALATYVVDRPVPDDLPLHTHFFWSSGAFFRDALARHPQIAGGWHGSGPGRTSRVIRDTLGSGSQHRVWLDYDEWHHAVTR